MILNITPPPDFTMEAEPDSQDVIPGDSARYDLILTSLYGFSSELYFTPSNLPPNTSANIYNTPLVPTDTAVLALFTSTDTPPGTYTVTVSAYEPPPGGGKITHSVDVKLVVLQPDFTIETDPETLEVVQGQQGDYDVILTSVNGFNSTCTLSVSNLPGGASGLFDPGTLVPTDTSTLTITVADTTPTGPYTFTVTGSEFIPGKGMLEHSVDVVLVVNSRGDFTIEVEPDTLIIPRGTNGIYNVTLTSISGFDSPCTLEVTGLPVDVAGSFNPAMVVPPGSSELTISVPETTEVGYHTLTITATEKVGEKSIQHSKNVTLFVTYIPWAFYIEAYPDTQRVLQGEDTTYEVVVIPNVEFTATCTLSLSIVGGMPTGVSYDFAPNPVFPNDTSILTISTTISTPLDLYELVIKGKANLKQESTTTVFLEVREGTGVEDWAENLNVPESFTLFQNHPNPFNPETRISYYLPRSCQVRITIYNVLGRKVKTLFDGQQGPGKQTLLWNGRDDDGVQLSSGIYFYRMQADNFQETKKMSLMK